ncbi:tetratricopeptide repeat protein 4-like [Styela clava]
MAQINKSPDPIQEDDNGLDEDDFDNYLATHPAFMDKDPTPEMIENSPLLQGLQQLKYEDDDDTPETQALAYKEDGNWHFKKKLYAQAVRAYTVALRKQCSDNTLNSTLYSNRAAANYYLKNYRSSIADSIKALNIEPTKIKSLLRGALCCEALEKHDETIRWAKKIVSIDEDHKQAKELLESAQKKFKIAERDRRKRETQERMKQKKMKALIDAIKNRKIKLDLSDLKPEKNELLSEEDSLTLSSVDTSNPSHAKVHFEDESLDCLAEKGRLIWPVLFCYPEYQVSEIVEQFHEDATFDDHLDIMFDDPPPWDTHNCYKVGSLEIYYENNEGKSIRRVSSNCTLGDVLTSENIIVKAGTPVFIILSKTSTFKDVFLSKYRTR